MKKNNLLLVAFIVLVGFIAFMLFARKEIKNINSNGKNIICFGDSITLGYGINPGEDYPAALARIVNIPIINAGVDGDTSTDALKRLGTDVLAKEPLLVLVEFGGNDFLHKIPLEVTVDNIRAVVEKIQAGGAMVAVVDISAGMFMREYRIALGKLSRKTGAIFIPAALSGIITNPSLKSDFLHPNVNGYQLIAQRVYRAITPYLTRNNNLKKAKK